MAYRWQDCYCRECQCMNLDDVYKYDKSRYYCTERKQYYNPNDRACSRMIYDENRSRYYIATVINKILGFPNNGYELKQIQLLKDEYMKIHPEYYQTLIEYDLIGPKIAKAIEEDPLNKLIATTFYESYIIPVANDIQHKQYKIAITKYKEMVFRLKNMYYIDDTITQELDINVKTLGKAHA